MPAERGPSRATPYLLFAAALGLRLANNLWLRPPEEAIFSDMGAYVFQAQRLLSHPGGVFPDATFFPIGTHLLLAATMALGGAHGLAAAAWLYALISALIVPLCYSLTGQLIAGPAWLDRAAHSGGECKTATRWALAAGLLAVVYVPLLSYAGYFLSEGPFALCLTFAALLSLRLVDGGSPRHAWLLGVAIGAGYLFRPQIFAAVALLCVFALWRRKQFARLRPALVARAAVPVVVAVAVMATFAHVRAGQARVFPSNAALNRVFARCHVMEVNIPVAHMGWSPPALRQLHRWEQKRPESWLVLNRAADLGIEMHTPPWQPARYHAYADHCVERTGIGGQARYALTHIAILWANSPWPDSADRPWRVITRWFVRGHAALLLAPLLWTLIAGMGRARARVGILAIYIWSLLLVAAMYFGSGRLRTPYDAIIIALACYAYASLVGAIKRHWRKRDRGRPYPSPVT